MKMETSIRCSGDEAGTGYIEGKKQTGLRVPAADNDHGRMR